MRLIRPILIIVIALIALRMQEVRAQTLQKRWKSVMIPGDTLYPASLSFADSNVGYLYCYRSGSDNLKTGTVRHYYFRTHDGGRTWSPISFGGPYFPLSVASACPIQPINGSTAYYACRDTTVAAGGAGGTQVLLLTTDSGTHWSKVNKSPYFHPWALLSVHNLIDYGSHGTVLARSTDGGSTFADVNDQRELGRYLFDSKWYGDSGRTLKFSYFDSLHWVAWLTSYADTDFVLSPPGITAATSSDGGVLWNIHNTPFPDSLLESKAFLCTESGGMGYGGGGFEAGAQQKSVPNTSYLFGRGGAERSTQGYENPYHFYTPVTSKLLSYFYTPDYGETWHFGCDFPYRVRGFEAVDTNEIWMTVLPKRNEYYDWANTKVFTTNYDASWIVHSTDLGKTWEIDSTTLDGRPYDQSFYDGAIVSSSDPAHVWIAAEYNYHTYIFRYNKNEQKSGVEEYVPLNYPNFVNIYPNPAQTHTTITLARGCPITNVTLVDIMGRDVTAPLTRLKEYSVDLDISKLQSGIYIAGIRTPYGPYAKLVSVVK